MLTTYSFAQVDRMEPPFWWSDMNYSDVQIMFYGKNIVNSNAAFSVVYEAFEEPHTLSCRFR